MTNIKNIESNQKTRRESLIKTFADPVLIYAVIAMSAIMNHYRSSLTAIYGITAYGAGWLIFRIFDYINKHHVIGFFAYIILAGAFIVSSRSIISAGSVNYPISWGLWFLTPVDAVQYNKWYTLAIFMLFLIFMLSVIYYFTRVRYRMFMNFLILIIPFAIYGKENEEMSTGFIIALCVGFVLIMADFRKLSDNSEAVVIDKPEAWKSVAVFTVIFAIISTLVPKPKIEADRTMIETMINADALTDRFLEMLNVFRDDSTGQQFRGTTDDTPLYYVISPQPMQLKTATFTSYNYNDDTWHSSGIDSRLYSGDEERVLLGFGGGVPEAVAFAAEIDSGFAGKYGFENLGSVGMTNIHKKNVKIFSTNRGGNSAPVPQGAISLDQTTYNDGIFITDGGTVLTDNGRKFKGDEQFSFSYMPDGFFSSDINKSAVDIIAGTDDYAQMLNDAYFAVSLYRHSAGSENIQNIGLYEDILLKNVSFYEEAENQLLDYGGNQRIYNLANEITAGLESEYDKAKALEWYFINNDFNYDMDYQKAVGENVEDFLFRTQRGVCYEYATAMTLMARAVGIPARYCEGFNMNQLSEGSTENYIVTGRDAHGFPELYIKGYGWKSFEPTMTPFSAEQEERSAADTLSRTGIIILILSVLAFGIIIFMPAITHRLFLILVGRRTPDEAIKAVIHRIYRVYGFSHTLTVREMSEAVRQRSGADISGTARLFEKSVYGGIGLDENDKSEAVEEYVSAYNALHEAKKTERRKHKKYRKNGI
ncbi:MAG: hypothetical protein K2N49_00705 [Ruminococcus sp.]|nr:hypothetical protein [Ruminococcus sp.]MDE7225376.1 hypothetical protein [Ruminococcus sp.]